MSSDDELRDLLVQEATTAIISGADPSRPTARSAHFLLPRAGGARLPALPSPPRNAGPVLGDQLPVDWTAWPGSSKLWRRWVARLRPRHERLWRKLGIFAAVLATTGWVRRHEGLLLQLAGFWSGETNTFLFPWGEATVTLEDMAVLGGLPLLGRPVWSRLPDELRGDVDALEAVRIALSRCTNRKAAFAPWVKQFVERPTGEVAGDGRGETEAATLLEHGAFLAMWLSKYVLPVPPFDVVRPDMFPLAAGLARGRCSALAPAVLANIYNDLSALKHYLNLSKSHQPFVAGAPLHILQLWVWERFPELRPAINSHGGDPSMPRATKWHNIRNPLDPGYIHAVFMSPEEFKWRPYGGSSFALPQGRSGCWVHCHEVATSKGLQSFAQCLRPCELVGMQCVEQYCPHRVARQLGFDQDVPGTVAHANSSRKMAWATYKMQPENMSFFAPQHDPGMTVQYAQWWKPYSSACAVAVANAANMKQLNVVVSPRKMKAEGLSGVDCGKKRHLEAGMTLQDDTEDKIPLAESPKLRIVSFERHKGRIQRHILKDDKTKQNSETVKDLVPRWAGKGRRRAISRRVAVKASSDAEAVLVSEVDKPSCGPVSKNENFEEQAPSSVIPYDEKNLSSEHGEVEGAASARSNKGIRAAIGVDVCSNLPDILAISGNELDEIFRKDSEASAIYMDLSKLTMATSNSDQPNEERHLVTIRRDESKDIMVQNNSDITLRQGPVNVTHVTNVDVLDGYIDEMQTRNVMEEGDQRAKVDRENSTLLEGNNDASYNGLVYGNNELVKRVISTKTLYYLRPFKRVKELRSEIQEPQMQVK
ncbi:unnamed protein product [Triticum turgidum subsp. durum]|uniref:Aminotransferase-like plant mobile domain-containing protein n=1 Tax=Triticum turgidum subsp. durum TaxID=4567 RepID=A0A9R0XI56_TRITD|nr:unnamed protein product [Triticum turgidum subsp. durum]